VIIDAYEGTGGDLLPDGGWRLRIGEAVIGATIAFEKFKANLLAPLCDHDDPSGECEDCYWARIR
jgi:hypothetical protein